MKFFIVAILFSVAMAAKLRNEPVFIISSNSPMNPDESYTYTFESSDGTKVEESGSQKQVGASGFQATGDHLPTPPPMPEHRHGPLVMTRSLKNRYKRNIARQIRNGNWDKPVTFVRSDNEFNPDETFSNYSFIFESEDGIKVNDPRIPDKPEDIGTTSKGSYSYVSFDGVTITVNWVADENGFQATGDHLPTASPMPEHSRRAPVMTRSLKNRYKRNIARKIRNANWNKPVTFMSSVNEFNPDEAYSFYFESEDGTKVEKSGNQKQVGPKPEDIGTVSKGSYSYVSPDGVTITVNWVADENGFQATGDHLPTPPPMPEHVIRLLAGAYNK